MLDDDALDLADVQALLGSSFASLRHADYWLLAIHNVEAFRCWLQAVLARRRVVSLNQLRRNDPEGSTRDDVLAIAFSHDGLLALGQQATDARPFTSAFTEGMARPSRRIVLGDDLAQALAWGDNRVHVLLAHFRSDANPAPLMEAELIAAGLRIIRRVATCPSYTQPGADGSPAVRKEPFGFNDGIGQPVLRGLPESSREARARRLAGPMYEDRVVAAGEFILGQINEFGEPAYCPDLQGWAAWRTANNAAATFGHNGSYLVVRQIEQNRQAFTDFDDAHPAPRPGAPSLVETMMGRFKDGRPLQTSPAVPLEPDAYRYRLADDQGLQCPHGAHARRANPRDTQAADVSSGVKVSKVHRLLRRGRPYRDGPPTCLKLGCGQADTACGTGMFFIALNAHIERQFEFIQQAWITNPNFGNQRPQTDPLLGAKGRVFSVPALPVGEVVPDLPAFTTLIGGGYFFLPGLAALRFLAGD